MFKKIGLLAVAALAFSFQAKADLVTSGNLIKNSTFAYIENTSGVPDHWTHVSGDYRIYGRTNVPGYNGEAINTFYGGRSDNIQFEQWTDLGFDGMNLGLIDTGLVNMDFRYYAGSNYADRDRVRMWVNFYDRDMNYLGQRVSSYFDRNEWSLIQYNDTVVPQGTRHIRTRLHIDRLDGTWASAGIAAPEVTFGVADTEDGRVALDQFGFLRDVPVMGVGILAMLGLAGARRKK